MAAYSERMKTHLSAYRRGILSVEEDGLWRRNQQPYPHILPESQLQLNIVPAIRSAFWEYYKEHASEVGLHTDFHHLNSSQAFAFNLFFPWLQHERSRGALLTALGVLGEAIRSWRFEHVPDQRERTTVDVYLELASGSRVFVEVKLTEQAFGSALPDASHQAKLSTLYRGRLTGKICADGVSDGAFFQQYQLFRNISHLELARGDRLIVLLPRANEHAWSAAEGFREFLSDDATRAYRLVSAEDFAQQLAEASLAEPFRDLAEAVAETRQKYLLWGAP